MTTPKTTTLTDPNTGREYTPCNASTDDGPCLRYTGHAMTKGGHRPSLARPLDPKRAEAAAAWKAMTPDEQQAELARRQQVSAARKAAHKAAPKAARKASTKPPSEAQLAARQAFADRARAKAAERQEAAVPA